MKIDDLKEREIEGGDSISEVLDDLARQAEPGSTATIEEQLARGVGFCTFAFDIDGVSMEIAKYARCFEGISPGLPVHCIAGTFADKADIVLDPEWHRFRLLGADGWDKWDNGRWFAALFYEDLPPNSEISSSLAREMWRQAVELAELLVIYIEEHDVGVLFPVNTNSNPGNLAFALAIVLASEVTGTPVINNNHDFYWEGGKEGCKRKLGEVPGPRDHFFRNHDNEGFFGLFQRIFPWNGRRWVQVNINATQTRRLIDRFHFRPEDVFTIGTGLSPEFFEACTPSQKRESRRRMALVLGGEPLIEPTPVALFREHIGSWMQQQHPVVCGLRTGERLDIAADAALYLLQPTRVVDRKRIWHDWDLIAALLDYPPFREAFERRTELTLTVHITGPVPLEHRACLEQMLDHYEAVLARVPEAIGQRLFVALSVGRQTSHKMAEALRMVDIYQLADLVLFPSLTEGRGLPIPESAAAGVPIVCSEYEPRSVFDQVVGADLPTDQQIRYATFPEKGYGEELLADVTSSLLDPASGMERIEHNRLAVKGRFSFDALSRTFAEILQALGSERVDS